MRFDLGGKTILITGGTSVLGREIAGRALRENARVLFTYFQNEALAGELRRKGAQGFRLDLTRRKDVLRFGEEMEKEISLLDALVLNAGLVRDHAIVNLSEDEFDGVIEADLTANFLLAKKLLPYLFRSGQGKILAVTSRAGVQGGVGEANYAAAKAGLNAFIKTLAVEAGREGVLANAVAPGFMMSRMTESLPEEVHERHRQESVLGCFQEPGEIADFVIYLLSDLVKHVSGQIFHWDSRRTKLF